MVEMKEANSSAVSEKQVSNNKQTSSCNKFSSAQVPPVALKVYGMVKWYNCKYNYGFISRLDNKQDLFVHRNGIKKCNPKKFKSLMDGDIVMFDVYDSEKGAEARNVTGPEGKPARPSRYAKFRPWYLDLLKKTKTLSIDDKHPTKERKNFIKKERSNEKANEKAIIKEKLEGMNTSSGASVNTSNEKHDTDMGYNSKSTSDEGDKKKYRNTKRKNFKKVPRKGSGKASEADSHPCNVCEKSKAAVDV